MPLYSEGLLEVVANVRPVRIQSVWVVNLLIFDVHLNIGKNWVQNVVYMSNERNWNNLLFHRRFPHPLLLPLRASFFHWHFKFRNHNTWQVLFLKPSTSVSNQVKVPIRLKFRIFKNFIEWGGKTKFWFLGQQHIVNYWDFPSRISRKCHERLVPNITRDDQ